MMEQFNFAYGRTVSVPGLPDLEFDFNNRARVSGRPTLTFDIRRLTPTGREFAGRLYVECRNTVSIGTERLATLIRAAMAEREAEANEAGHSGV
jgi:hypothetical protein